ncbi:regulator [Pectobacterium carotovorum]|uniref:regulator n=1 Tax=Pectobacterium carotovorum TaxID=554 RepID=UPI0029DCC7E2|nr:regulator [Pectobacterium carotovorum]MDX6913936.1 regulator [Pectobacterium carotovorum]
MSTNITISIPEPYITLEEYCRRTGTKVTTARAMANDGRLPIKKKTLTPGKSKANGLLEINMVDLLLRAVSESHYASVTLNP